MKSINNQYIKLFKEILSILLKYALEVIIVSMLLYLFVAFIFLIVFILNILLHQIDVNKVLSNDLFIYTGVIIPLVMLFLLCSIYVLEKAYNQAKENIKHNME